jgi:hypothetical protein
MSELIFLTKRNDLDPIEPWCAWKFEIWQRMLRHRLHKNEPVLDAIVA